MCCKVFPQVQIPCCSLPTKYCTLCTVHCTQYTAHWTLHTVHLCLLLSAFNAEEWWSILLGVHCSPLTEGLHCTALHCTAVCCTALHFTELHCTALHCTVVQHKAIDCTFALRSMQCSISFGQYMLSAWVMCLARGGPRTSTGWGSKIQTDRCGSYHHNNCVP